MRYQGLLECVSHHVFLWSKIFSFGSHIPAKVDILGVATHSDTLRRVDTRIDGIETFVAERINKNLEVGQGLGVARLQCRTIAGRINIKDGDGAENGIGVDACAPSVILEVGVGHIVVAVPVGLQEAEYIRRLVTSCASLSQLGSESTAFDQSAVLVLGGEERRALYLFPEVESGGVPSIRAMLVDMQLIAVIGS